MSQTTTPDSRSFPLRRQCPFAPPPEYDRLRAEEPVCKVQLLTGGTAWLVTRYEDVRTVLSSPAFSADGTRPGFPTPLPGFEQILQRPPFIRMDPPQHSFYRRMLIQDFTVKRIKTMRPGIQATVDRLLDDLLAQTPPVDLVEAFALPVPSLVICQLLGVPYDDHEFFQTPASARGAGAARPDPLPPRSLGATATGSSRPSAPLTGSTEQHPVLADCYRALRRYDEVEPLWQELREVSPSAELVAEGRIVYAGSLADRGDVSGGHRRHRAGRRARSASPASTTCGCSTCSATCTSGPATCLGPGRLFDRVVAVDPDFGDAAARRRRALSWRGRAGRTDPLTRGRRCASASTASASTSRSPEGVFSAADHRSRHPVPAAVARPGDPHAGARASTSAAATARSPCGWRRPVRRAVEAVDRDAVAVECTAAGAAANGVADRVTARASLGYDDVDRRPLRPHRVEHPGQGRPGRPRAPAGRRRPPPDARRPVAVVVVDRLAAGVRPARREPGGRGVRGPRQPGYPS